MVTTPSSVEQRHAAAHHLLHRQATDAGGALGDDANDFRLAQHAMDVPSGVTHEHGAAAMRRHQARGFRGGAFRGDLGDDVARVAQDRGDVDRDKTHGGWALPNLVPCALPNPHPDMRKPRSFLQ